MVAVIVVACIIRYDFKAVLEVLKALGAVIGLMVGTMGTYFFTQVQVQQKDQQMLEASNRIQALPDLMVSTLPQGRRAQVWTELQNLSEDLKTKGIPEQLAISGSPRPSIH